MLAESVETFEVNPDGSHAFVVVRYAGQTFALGRIDHASAVIVNTVSVSSIGSRGHAPAAECPIRGGAKQASRLHR